MVTGEKLLQLFAHLAGKGSKLQWVKVVESQPHYSPNTAQEGLFTPHPTAIPKVSLRFSQIH